MDNSDETDRPEPLVLNKDGTATINVGSQTINIRMPDLGEYGEIMDRVESDRFDVTRLFNEAVAQRQKAAAEGDKETFELARKNERAIDEIRRVFFVKTIELLGDVPVETVKLPRWVVSKDAMDRLLNHWETVPFLGSAQAM